MFPEQAQRHEISIHALREEGDTGGTECRHKKCPFLSTPSARRATKTRYKSEINQWRFLSTPSARRATGRRCGQAGSQRFLSTPSARRATSLMSAMIFTSIRISIHALREEGDASTTIGTTKFWNFYPRPPRGGRPAATTTPPWTRRFLSTPSARRATAKTETKSLFSNKLYNILHEFRRALIYNGSKNYPNHAK